MLASPKEAISLAISFIAKTYRKKKKGEKNKGRGRRKHFNHTLFTINKLVFSVTVQ